MQVGDALFVEAPQRASAITQITAAKYWKANEREASTALA